MVILAEVLVCFLMRIARGFKIMFEPLVQQRVDANVTQSDHMSQQSKTKLSLLTTAAFRTSSPLILDRAMLWSCKRRQTLGLVGRGWWELTSDCWGLGRSTEEPSWQTRLRNDAVEFASWSIQQLFTCVGLDTKLLLEIQWRCLTSRKSLVMLCALISLSFHRSNKSPEKLLVQLTKLSLSLSLYFICNQTLKLLVQVLKV